MRAISGSPLKEAARIACKQHGNITSAQLLRAGASRSAIDRWVGKGLLHPEFRGVHRLGHRAPSTEARYMAAVLACGDGAALSGLAAAFLMGLVRGRAPIPEVSSMRNRHVPGVITHRVRRLECWTVQSIRTTTVARTLVDLAGRLSLDDLARAGHEAQVRYRIKASAVDAAIRLGIAGAANLRAIFHGDADVVLSRLERRFLDLLRSEGLPLPRTNRLAGGRHVDCRWPAQRLTVELDGYRYHSTRHAWEQDRRREREARARGDEFRRFTYGDVVEDRTLMLAELHALLGMHRR
jgi:very-short-patch-repair endonuclease